MREFGIIFRFRIISLLKNCPNSHSPNPLFKNVSEENGVVEKNTNYLQFNWKTEMMG